MGKRRNKGKRRGIRNWGSEGIKGKEGKKERRKEVIKKIGSKRKIRRRKKKKMEAMVRGSKGKR
ncbi:TPA: hypothetical protein ACX6QF_003400 [Photobacterium damselae]